MRLNRKPDPNLSINKVVLGKNIRSTIIVIVEDPSTLESIVLYKVACAVSAKLHCNCSVVEVIADETVVASSVSIDISIDKVHVLNENVCCFSQV